MFDIIAYDLDNCFVAFIDLGDGVSPLTYWVGDSISDLFHLYLGLNRDFTVRHISSDDFDFYYESVDCLIFCNGVKL